MLMKRDVKFRGIGGNLIGVVPRYAKLDSDSELQFVSPPTGWGMSLPPRLSLPCLYSHDGHQVASDRLCFTIQT